jgi:hypothetical protein
MNHAEYEKIKRGKEVVAEKHRLWRVGLWRAGKVFTTGGY